MAIKSYNTKADYDAAVKSTIESQVSMIETTREIIVDGVNVVTTQPTAGDVVFLDDQNKIIYVKGGVWIQKANIPVAWTHVGYVYFRKGKQVGVINKDGADRKWLDVCQYALTAFTSTSVNLKLRMAPNYDVETSIDVTLTSTNIDATTASEISAAVAAKATEVGDTNAWWAYLADANGNKVTDNGTQIIVQCDVCVTWQTQYYYGATGCTISLASWGDMPENSSYWRGEHGFSTNYTGAMNITRYIERYSGDGRTPTADEAIGPKAGNDAPVNLASFNDSEYCAALRAEYGDYRTYIEKCYAVVRPQKYGCFSLPGGKETTLKYALKTAPTKDGGEKYKYPFLYYCYSTTYGVDGLDYGDWFAPGVAEGTDIMDDATINALGVSVSKMGTISIDRSAYRWFAARCNANGAWFFDGWSGILTYYYVYGAFRSQAVTLLTID